MKWSFCRLTLSMPTSGFLTGRSQLCPCDNSPRQEETQVMILRLSPQSCLLRRVLSWLNLKNRLVRLVPTSHLFFMLTSLQLCLTPKLRLLFGLHPTTSGVVQNKETVSQFFLSGGECDDCILVSVICSVNNVCLFFLCFR